MPSRVSKRPSSPGLWTWLTLALLVVVVDQFTKTLIVGWFDHGHSRPVTGFFNLVRAHNTGAAFSFLANAGGWQRWLFVALGLAAAGFIVWMIRGHAGQKLFCFAVSLIMGGALGNVIDRLLHGYVVDFLQFRFDVLQPLFPGGYFPAFNVADSAITVGALALIVDELRRVRRGEVGPPSSLALATPQGGRPPTARQAGSVAGSLVVMLPAYVLRHQRAQEGLPGTARQSRFRGGKLGRDTA